MAASAAQILKHARERYLTPDQWTQGTYFDGETSCLIGACGRAMLDLDGRDAVVDRLNRDADYPVNDWDDPDLVDALGDRSSTLMYPVVEALLACANALFPPDGPLEWLEKFNDSHTLPEVQRVAECAIERTSA